MGIGKSIVWEKSFGNTMEEVKLPFGEDMYIHKAIKYYWLVIL